MNEESVKNREKRVIVYCVVGLSLFAIFAGVSDSPEFLFAFVAVAAFLVGRNLMFYSQKYMAASFKYQKGEFKFFPLVQLGLLIPLVGVSAAIGYGAVKFAQIIL